MPGNYSALGGYGMNPYDPRRDPREANADGRPVLNTGGSSSGIGTAASFWAANVGTETSGSILSPANQNMLVGIKPTVGRISRYGDHSHHGRPGHRRARWRAPSPTRPSCSARSRARRPTPTTRPPRRARRRPNRDYTVFLKREGLKGARIGIPRAFYYDRITVAGRERNRAAGSTRRRPTSMADAIEVLKKEGAVIVDPADIPSVVDPDPENNFLAWGTCGGPDDVKGKDQNCSVVLKYGMKRDFNAWLATLGPASPVKTLTDLRAFNIAHPRRNAIKYGQANLDISDEMDLERDRAR